MQIRRVVFRRRRSEQLRLLFCVKEKLRAVDARRFVREFKKEYGDHIEDARKVKTEGDALDALLGWMDGARPSRLSAKDGCWRFTGEDVAVVWWVNEGFYKFFRWCVPYVEPKTARFSQQTEFGWGTLSRVKYKIVDGRLEEFSRAITLHERDFVFEPSKVLGVSKFLKRYRPTAVERDGEYAVDIGLNGYGWDEVGDDDGCSGWNLRSITRIRIAKSGISRWHLIC